MIAIKKIVKPSMLCMFALDMLLFCCALFISIGLRFEGNISMDLIALYTRNMPMILAMYVLCFVLGGIYIVMWRYAGIRDMIRLTVVSAIGCGATLLLNSIAGLGMSRGVLILVALLSLLQTGGARFVQRLFDNGKPPLTRKTQTPLMIIGAGEAGAFIVKYCGKYEKTNRPVLMLDDDPTKFGLRVQGVPVIGGTDQIFEMARHYNVGEIILAIPSLDQEKQDRILAQCSETGCHVRILSKPSDAQERNGSGKNKLTIRELNIADFLSREEIKLDTDQIRDYICGKTVLVTGGGGSIGSEICRQIMKYQPKLLIVFDIYENNVYELECELKRKHGEGCAVEVLIGSIRDKARLDEIFDAYKPTVVFHAAAHKHVPLMEKCPVEAIKNNVFGTINLLESASAHGVERLVQLSTDKAVNPTNIMGATKRITEMLIQSYAQRTEMKCMAVRFGNVLGSHGSVIPIMEAQIRQGGPVTVTHEDITRYFMTIPEAAQLVLQAGVIAQAGSICVLDMGKPVRIMDLAKKLIRIYGMEPDVDIPIEITGLRVGEKLYEELLMDSERDSMVKSPYEKILIVPVDPVDTQMLDRHLKMLADAIEQDEGCVVRIITQMVPSCHLRNPWRTALAHDVHRSA